MKNSIYLILVLITFSCKPVEQVNKQKKPVVTTTTTTTKAEYDQYIKDTQWQLLDKIPNKIRIYGQILCPGARRASLGFDKPIDPRENEIYDIKYRPQICGSFAYRIRKVIAGDTILLNKILRTNTKGRYDITLDYGHYILQPMLDAKKLKDFTDTIPSKRSKESFLSIVKKKWVVVSEKDTAIILTLRPVREDRFKNILEATCNINNPRPPRMNKR